MKEEGLKMGISLKKSRSQVSTLLGHIGLPPQQQDVVTDHTTCTWEGERERMRRDEQEC